MTAALTPRCHVCGSRLGSLEPAVVSTGHAEVCADGYACATRANAQREGKARFAVVTPPPSQPRATLSPQPRATVDEIK